MLHEAREPRAGDINRWPSPLRFATVFAGRFTISVRVHVPVLSVLAVAVHGEELLRNSGDEMNVNQRSRNQCLSIPHAIIQMHDPHTHNGRIARQTTALTNRVIDPRLRTQDGLAWDTRGACGKIRDATQTQVSEPAKAAASTYLPRIGGDCTHDLTFPLISSTSTLNWELTNGTPFHQAGAVPRKRIVEMIGTDS